eukprot:2119957-Alexandrium_andersonii.AAC.1
MGRRSSIELGRTAKQAARTPNKPRNTQPLSTSDRRKSDRRTDGRTDRQADKQRRTKTDRRTDRRTDGR